MNKLISIVVPIYKVEQYLERCIESIRKQTYPYIEIILVDDGSPDSCPQICDDYARKDKRIVVIHKKNGGLSDARNAGIEIAKGEYIGFVDSDDYIHPQMYEQLCNALEECDADISVCDVEKVTQDQYIIQETEGNRKVYSGVHAAENIYTTGMYLKSVVAWNKLYKKELFADIRYPKGRLHEDEFTTYKLLYASEKVVYLSNKYYYYMQRKDSIMGEKQIRINDDVLDAYEEVGDFFERKKEDYILQLVKYRYLCLLKKYAVDLKKIGNKEKARKLDEKYDIEYRKYIRVIKKWKRKVRLGLYRWIRIYV